MITTDEHKDFERLQAAYDQACGRIAELETRDKPIVLACSYDWQQIYIDGDQTARGHRLNPGEVLDALGIPYREIYYTDAEVDDGENVFPDTITEAEILTHLRGNPT